MSVQTRERVKSSLSPLILMLSVFFLFTIQLFAANYDNEANFKQIYSKTVNGDIAATGSPIMCAKNKKGKCDWDYQGYLFNINPLTLNDGGNTIFSKNSGGAILSLPADVNGSDILWARLYWQGHIFGLGDHDAFENAINGLENVKMVDPKGNTHSLSANSSDIYYYGYDDKNVYNSGEKGYRYFYQASADVTSIVQQSYDSTHNYFIVGNINATMIKDTHYILDTKLNAYVKWGNWGGWSLMVAYKDVNASIKNISLYDGFKFLLPPFGGTASLTIDLPANSFYTPTFGVVKSKTIMFAAGAEKKIAADKLEMKNKNLGFLTVSNSLNPADNQINDSITYLDQEINATRIFNAGIDLDTYDTSNILANGQTTTSLKVTMTASANAADQAFVGFIGISNDIYQPKICYIEQLYDSNSTEINTSSNVKVGDILQVKLTIRNDDNQAADDVSIVHNFDDNKTLYENNSTIVNNIDNSGNLLGDTNQTDSAGDDLTDFNQSSKSLTIRLGRSANGTNGGTFNPNDTVYAKYKTTINTVQSFNLSYQTSYIFNIAGQQFNFDGPLPKCTDFNNTIQALAPIGSFNVVHDGFTGTTDPIIQTDPKNALYTQIVNQPFTVKILALDADKTTLKPYTGDLNVAIIETPSYTGDTTTDNSLCATAIGGSSSGFITIPFSNDSSVTRSFTYPSASKNVSFGIKYLDSNGTAGYVCSRDKFAVRPDKFDFNITGTVPHKAGKNYLINFSALDFNNTSSADYNETVGSSFKVDINETKTGCSTGDFNQSLNTTWSFLNGNKAITSKYSEVGIIKITIKDSNDSHSFAYVDHDDTPDSQRLITPYDKNISFTPDHFDINATLVDGGQKFTYLSNDLNMSTILNIDVTAKTENNTTTTNYNSACYAQNTDYNISYGNLTITPANALTRILYMETNTSTEGNNSINSDINLTDINSSIFSTDNNGTGSIHIKINFDRNASRAVNPFDLNITDINVTDTNNTKGNQSLDQNTTFYYGRVHSRDYRFKGLSGIATIYYEVYSDQNKTVRNSFDINGSESVNSINWYTNTLHNNLFEGNVTKYSSIGGVKFESNTNNTTNSAHLSNVANGTETIDVTAPKTPYKDKIDMNSSSWLIYNPTDFMVEFYKKGSWAGQGKLGKTVDLNVSTIQNQRIDW